MFQFIANPMPAVETARRAKASGTRRKANKMAANMAIEPTIIVLLPRGYLQGPPSGGQRQWRRRPEQIGRS